MFDLILKMNSKWLEKWGCVWRLVARLGFTATGDCQDIQEVRKMHGYLYRLWVWVTSFEIIMQNRYTPEFFRGQDKCLRLGNVFPIGK